MRVFEHLHPGDKVRQGNEWGTVKRVRPQMVEVRWDRAGLLSRSRRTWENRDALMAVLPE